jgi:hypothetical protein
MKRTMGIGNIAVYIWEYFTFTLTRWKNVVYLT